jgi:hypothetical protein
VRRRARALSAEPRSVPPLLLVFPPAPPKASTAPSKQTNKKISLFSLMLRKFKILKNKSTFKKSPPFWKKVTV